MYIEFKLFHSYIAYLTLAALLLSIALNANAWLKNKPYSKTNRLFSHFGMVAAVTQLTMGLLLYFISPLGFNNFSSASMKNALSRMFILEHPLMMIIGIALIIIGFINARSSTTDNQKNKKVAIYYTLGLILILSRIPWSSWF